MSSYLYQKSSNRKAIFILEKSLFWTHSTLQPVPGLLLELLHTAQALSGLLLELLHTAQALPGLLLELLHTAQTLPGLLVELLHTVQTFFFFTKNTFLKEFRFNSVH